MIISWLLSALVFSACIAFAATAADSLARSFGRATRWIWCAALVSATLWPIVVPIAAYSLPRFRAAAARLPAVRVLPDGATLFGASSSPVSRTGELLLLSAWALASVLLIVRLVRAAQALRTIRARAERRTLDGVPVLVTDTVGPATIGLRRGAVIVPRTLLDLDESLRALVLRHEEEHCRAKDPRLLLASSVAVALFPWNVALWMIARRLRLALEIDCDARVIAGGAEPTRYGQLLLWIASHPGRIALAPMLVTGQSHLERRIVAMRFRLARPRAAHVCLAAGVLAVAIFAACSEGSPNGPLAGSNPATQPSQVAASAARAVGPVRADAPYFEFQVERQARQIPRTGNLRYPTDMRLANKEGAVLAQFVVRETGLVDMTTFKALQSTHPAFTAAVTNALPTMRFEAAEVGGHKVPQLVQQPFTFSLSPN